MLDIDYRLVRYGYMAMVYDLWLWVVVMDYGYTRGNYTPIRLQP